MSRHATGSGLAALSAGGWLRQTDPRLAPPSGGRRGFYAKENSDPWSSISLCGVLLLTLNGEVRTVGWLLALTGDASVARSLSLEICTLFLRADKMLTCPLLYTPAVMVQTVSSGQGFDMPVVLATRCRSWTRLLFARCFFRFGVIISFFFLSFFIFQLFFFFFLHFSSFTFMFSMFSMFFDRCTPLRRGHGLFSPAPAACNGSWHHETLKFGDMEKEGTAQGEMEEAQGLFGALLLPFLHFSIPPPHTGELSTPAAL